MLHRLLARRDPVAELRLAFKMTLGGTAAWWLASALGAQRPLFAALVPLVAMTGDPFAAVSVSLGRILGVFAGVGIGVGITHLDAAPTLKVAIALLLATVAGIVLKVGERPNLEVPIAALFLIGFAGANVSALGIQRIWETGVGAIVAIVVSSALWPPDPLRALERRLDRLRQALAADLAAVADDLATGSGETAALLDDVREHSLDAVRDVFELEPARRALRWSPLRHKDRPRLAEVEERIGLGARVFRHARTLARDVADMPLRDPALAMVTRHLADAVDRSLRGRDASEPLERAAAELALHTRGGDAAIVASQLRQLLADLRPA